MSGEKDPAVDSASASEEAEFRDKDWRPNMQPYDGPLPEPTMNCESGWLAPDGTIYPCGDAEHALWAMRFSRKFQIPPFEMNHLRGILRAGWIPLRRKCFELEMIPQMTLAQKRAIQGWAALHHDRTPLSLGATWSEVHIKDDPRCRCENYCFNKKH